MPPWKKHTVSLKSEPTDGPSCLTKAYHGEQGRVKGRTGLLTQGIVLRLYTGSAMDGKLFDDGKKRKKREYPPDPIWDVVVKIWYPSGVAEPFRKQVNRFVQSLKDYGATPETIHMAASCYKKKYPTMSFTLMAVVKLWDVVSEPEKPTRTPGVDLEHESPRVRKQYEAWRAWSNKRGLSG